jgi:hypothetical protein
MARNENGYIINPGADPLALISPELLENSPNISNLKTQFSNMLPKNFDNIRTLISPIPTLPSVLRADCRNQSCGVRATIRITRNNGIWEILPESFEYSRARNNPCSDCKQHLETQGVAHRS